MSEHLNNILALVERPVKQMLFSYWELFCKKNLLDTGKLLKTNIFRISSEYRDFGEMVTSNKDLLNDKIQRESLLFMPDKTNTMRLIIPIVWKKVEGQEEPVRTPVLKTEDAKKEDGEIEIWEMYLETIPADKPWDLELIESFGAWKPKINEQVGQLISMCRFAFQQLHNIHSKNKITVLATLKLVVNAENLSLRLVDSKFPDYQHPTALGVVIRKLNDKELEEVEF